MSADTATEGASAVVPDVAATADATPTDAKRGPGRPRGSRTRKPKGDSAPRTARAERGPGRPSNIDKLTEQLATLFTEMGAIAFVVNPAVGAIIIEDAQSNAQALARVAATNDRVRRMLSGGVNGSAWIGLLIAFGSTGMKIRAALTPAPALGDAPPSDPLAPFGPFLVPDADAG